MLSQIAVNVAKFGAELINSVEGCKNLEGTISGLVPSGLLVAAGTLKRDLGLFTKRIVLLQLKFNLLACQLNSDSRKGAYFPGFCCPFGPFLREKGIKTPLLGGEKRMLLIQVLLQALPKTIYIYF